MGTFFVLQFMLVRLSVSNLAWVRNLLHKRNQDGVSRVDCNWNFTLKFYAHKCPLDWMVSIEGYRLVVAFVVVVVSWSKFWKSSLVRCSSKSIRSSSSSIEQRVLSVVSAKKSITDENAERFLRGGRSLPSRIDLRVSRRSERKSLRSFSSLIESWVLRALSAMNLDTRAEIGDSPSCCCCCSCCCCGWGGVTLAGFFLRAVLRVVLSVDPDDTEVSFFFLIDMLAIRTFLPNIVIVSCSLTNCFLPKNFIIMRSLLGFFCGIFYALWMWHWYEFCFPLLVRPLTEFALNVREFVKC